MPHVAFRVDNIAEAAKGLKVLLEPFDAGIARVGFYQAGDGRGRRADGVLQEVKTVVRRHRPAAVDGPGAVSEPGVPIQLVLRLAIRRPGRKASLLHEVVRPRGNLVEVGRDVGFEPAQAHDSPPSRICSNVLLDHTSSRWPKEV